MVMTCSVTHVFLKKKIKRLFQSLDIDLNHFFLKIIKILFYVMLLWSNKVWPNASLWLNHRSNNSGTHNRRVHLYSSYKANPVALEKELRS